MFDPGFDTGAKTKNPHDVVLRDKPKSSGKIKINDPVDFTDDDGILTIDGTDLQYQIDENYDLSKIISETEKNLKNKK